MIPDLIDLTHMGWRVIFAPKACDFCPNDSERIINHFAAFDTKALAFITVAF